jgi:hypothetical protein
MQGVNRLSREEVSPTLPGIFRNQPRMGIPIDFLLVMPASRIQKIPTTVISPQARKGDDLRIRTPDRGPHPTDSMLVVSEAAQHTEAMS